MQRRVDELRKGQRFRCVSGHEWIFERQDGALSGAYKVRSAKDGRTNYFAGCAVVELLDLDPPDDDEEDDDGGEPDYDGPSAEDYEREPDSVRCSLDGCEFHEPANYGD